MESTIAVRQKQGQVRGKQVYQTEASVNTTLQTHSKIQQFKLVVCVSALACTNDYKTLIVIVFKK